MAALLATSTAAQAAEFIATEVAWNGSASEDVYKRQGPQRPQERLVASQRVLIRDGACSIGGDSGAE